MDLLERITAGTNDILTLEIDIDEYQGTLEYRKLNINEQKKYRRIINKALGKVSTTERNGFRGNGQEAVAELDIAVSGDAEYKAEVYLIETSLTINGEKRLSEATIKQMDAALFDEIVRQLKEINNLENNRNSTEEVKKS